MSSGSWEKYKCPPDMLTVEEKLKTLQLTDEQARELINAQIETNILTAPTKEERKAWAAMKVQRRSRLMVKQTKEAFIEDFVLWLQGRSKYSVESITEDVMLGGVKKTRKTTYTPWGNKPITFLDGVDKFLEGPILNRDKVIRTLTKLKCTQPRNVDEAWIYYKYLIRKVGIDTDENAVKEQRFYNDYDYLEKNPLMVDATTTKNKILGTTGQPLELSEDPAYTVLSTSNPRPKPFDKLKYDSCRRSTMARATAGDSSVVESEEYASLTPETRVYVMSILRNNVKATTAAAMNEASLLAIAELLGSKISAAANAASIPVDSSKPKSKKDEVAEEIQTLLALSKSGDVVDLTEQEQKDALETMTSIISAYATDTYDEQLNDKIQKIKEAMTSLSADATLLDRGTIETQVKEMEEIKKEMEKRYLEKHTKMLSVFSKKSWIPSVVDALQQAKDTQNLIEKKAKTTAINVGGKNKHVGILSNYMELLQRLPNKDSGTPSRDLQPHETLLRELITYSIGDYIDKVLDEFQTGDDFDAESAIKYMTSDDTRPAKAVTDTVKSMFPEGINNDIIKLAGMGSVSPKDIIPLLKASYVIDDDPTGHKIEDLQSAFSVLRAGATATLSRSEFLEEFQKMPEGEQWRMAIAYRSMQETEFILETVLPKITNEDNKRKIFLAAVRGMQRIHRRRQDGDASDTPTVHHENLLKAHEYVEDKYAPLVKNIVSNHVMNSTALGFSPLSVPPDDSAGPLYEGNRAINKFTSMAGNKIGLANAALDEHMNKLIDAHIMSMNASDDFDAFHLLQNAIHDSMKQDLHPLTVEGATKELFDEVAAEEKLVKETLREGASDLTIKNAEEFLESRYKEYEIQKKTLLQHYITNAADLHNRQAEILKKDKELTRQSTKVSNFKMMMKINQAWVDELGESLKTGYKDYEDLKKRHYDESRSMQKIFLDVTDRDTAIYFATKKVMEDFHSQQNKIIADIEEMRKNKPTDPEELKKFRDATTNMYKKKLQALKEKQIRSFEAEQKKIVNMIKYKERIDQEIADTNDILSIGADAVQVAKLQETQKQRMQETEKQAERLSEEEKQKQLKEQEEALRRLVYEDLSTDDSEKTESSTESASGSSGHASSADSSESSSDSDQEEEEKKKLISEEMKSTQERLLAAYQTLHSDKDETELQKLVAPLIQKMETETAPLSGARKAYVDAIVDKILEDATIKKQQEQIKTREIEEAQKKAKELEEEKRKRLEVLRKQEDHEKEMKKIQEEEEKKKLAELAAKNRALEEAKKKQEELLKQREEEKRKLEEQRQRLAEEERKKKLDEHFRKLEEFRKEFAVQAATLYVTDLEKDSIPSDIQKLTEFKKTLTNQVPGDDAPQNITAAYEEIIRLVNQRIDELDRERLARLIGKTPDMLGLTKLKSGTASRGNQTQAEQEFADNLEKIYNRIDKAIEKKGFLRTLAKLTNEQRLKNIQNDLLDFSKSERDPVRMATYTKIYEIKKEEIIQKIHKENEEKLRQEEVEKQAKEMMRIRKEEEERLKNERVEAERKRQEEEKKRQEEEEERKRKEEEEKKRLRIEERKQRQEEERMRQHEEIKKRQEEEEKKRGRPKSITATGPANALTVGNTTTTHTTG